MLIICSHQQTHNGLLVTQKNQFEESNPLELQVKLLIAEAPFDVRSRDGLQLCTKRNEGVPCSYDTGNSKYISVILILAANIIPGLIKRILSDELENKVKRFFFFCQ